MRKYDKYVIEIIHLNGNKQIKKAEDASSYSATLSLYKKIKENNYNNNVTINVVGISDEERGILFTKKNLSADNSKKNIKELIESIEETALELKQQLCAVKDMFDLSNKKRSNLEHMLIEAIDAETLTENEKLKIFDEMRETVLMRRDYKILNNIRIQVMDDLNMVISKIQNISDTYDKNISTNYNILKELIYGENEALKDTHIIREYPYKNAKERLNLMKQLQNKYDKIVNVEDKKKLVCYNKCKGA